MSTTLLANAERLTVLLGLCVAALCGMALGPTGFVSAAVGGAIGTANLFVVRRLAARAVRATLETEAAAGIGPLLSGMLLKMIALFAVVWIGLRVAKLSLLPFTFGLFVFVAALLGAALWSAFHDGHSQEDGQGAT